MPGHDDEITAEDATDRASIETFRRKLAAGEEELVPAAVVDRILAGESRIRVWREHRGLDAAALAGRPASTPIVWVRSRPEHARPRLARRAGSRPLSA